MSIAALPFASFLLCLEFAVGSQLVLLLPQFRSRNEVSPGFLKMGTLMALSGALLAWAIVPALPTGDEVGGFPLDQTFFQPMRAAVILFTVLAGVCTLVVWRNKPAAGRTTGLLAAVVGVAALLLAAAMVRLPTWNYAGTALALLAGAASLGAVSLGMTLGHWYLVTPRLPEQPLNDITRLLFVLIIVQSALLVLHVLVPVRATPLNSDLPEIALGQNLWFWLRVAVGLVFPLALAFMAWQSSVVRAMMSATGLLYIAMGAVLAGEVLARALLFTTARPL